MENIKILVVDDEPFILKSLVFILKKEGFEVITATDGDEALEQIRAERPQLIFLDLMMPKRDGYSVCEIVKNDPELKDMCVVLLTARGQASDRERGFEAGADEYVTKPFSPSKVVALARSILSTIPASNPSS